MATPKTEELTGRHTLDLERSPEIPKSDTELLASVPAMQVTDDRSCAEATRMIVQSGAAIKLVEEYFDEDRELAHRLHTSITTKIRNITAPFREVRRVLEPRIKTYMERKDRLRMEQEEADRRTIAESERQAREEAARIQREADARAAELRKVGDIAAAREAQQRATAQATAVIDQAEEMTSVGLILPAAKPLGGPGEARPWVGEVHDLKALCRAIGAGTVVLTTEQQEPLCAAFRRILNLDQLAKRFGQEEIGIEGCRGTRGLQLRFSAKAPGVPYKNNQEPEW